MNSKPGLSVYLSNHQWKTLSDLLSNIVSTTEQEQQVIEKLQRVAKEVIEVNETDSV